VAKTPRPIGEQFTGNALVDATNPIRVDHACFAAQTPMVRKLIDSDWEGAPARGIFFGYLKSTLKLPSFMEWAQAGGLDVSAFRAEIRREKFA
jgi:hypothetical protein